METNVKYNAGIYLRLSKDDDPGSESFSIGTQRAILTDYCAANNIKIHKEYVDDGFSGLNFARPGFQNLLKDVEHGIINMVITKDLSRLGRDYIMTGYYSEIYFPTKGIRYIAVADRYDSEKHDNEIAPFKNILNEMYARDISIKIKSAKRQLAKQGLFVGSQAPYGYIKAPDNKNKLIIDPEAAEVVRLIFSLAEKGLGNIAIAAELKSRGIMSPSAHKYQKGDKRFARFPSVLNQDFCRWSHGTINQIINNPVYTGQLVSLKTESLNCKIKHRTPVPQDQRIITENAHDPIIGAELFAHVQEVRAKHYCVANNSRYNLFRGKLFCECCGHPLTISRKQLKYRVADIYLCMYHYAHQEICPQTHRIYHDMLYPYVLQQVKAFARSMKRRRINSPLRNYADIEELTPEILDAAIERIEISHVKYNAKPGNVIHIYWKLG